MRRMLRLTLGILLGLSAAQAIAQGAATDYPSKNFNTSKIFNKILFYPRLLPLTATANDHMGGNKPLCRT